MTLASIIQNIRNISVMARQAQVSSAVAAFVLLDGNGNVILDGRNLAGSAGAAAGLAALISGEDLTVAGTLTALATNAGTTNPTEGALLRDALLGLGGRVTFGGRLEFKSVDTPVAAAGTNVGTAAALGVGNVLFISSDSAAKGVKMTSQHSGIVTFVINTSATAAILYPPTGGTINGLAANAGVLIPASKGTLIVASGEDTCYTHDLPARSTAA